MLTALRRLARSGESTLHEQTGAALVSRGLATVIVESDRERLRYNFSQDAGRYRHFYSFTYKLTAGGRAVLGRV